MQMFDLIIELQDEVQNRNKANDQPLWYSINGELIFGSIGSNNDKGTFETSEVYAERRNVTFRDK